MIIDEHIANYSKMIEQETNPVFKMLYELNMNLLIKLKNTKCQDQAKDCAVSLYDKEGVE